MKLYFQAVLLALSTLGLWHSAFAADPLAGPEVKALLSGSLVWASKHGTEKGSGSSSLAIAQSASLSVRMEFSADGKAVRTFVGVRNSRSETGRWWVNKKGKLCMEWPDQPKKKCSTLVPGASGGYELLGKGGKRRQLVFDKVTR